MSQLSYADLHIHTCYSDGWPTPRAVIEYVRRQTELDVIAITDHDTIEGALWAADYAAGLSNGPEVIVGEEVSSRDGHILGLFLTSKVEPGMPAEATVDAIHDQGGLAICAHPFWRTEQSQRSRSGKTSKSAKIHGVGWKAGGVDFDAIEVENATPGLYLFNQMAYRLKEETLLAAVGGSDAHILDAIGRACTSFPGDTVSDLRSAILAATTTAERTRYRAMGLVRYMAWTIDYQRQRRLAAEA
jgi:predicted metal-dependent phosphoesterase TrpH